MKSERNGKRKKGQVRAINLLCCKCSLMTEAANIAEASGRGWTNLESSSMRAYMMGLCARCNWNISSSLNGEYNRGYKAGVTEEHRRCLEVIAAEPELSGPMPNELRVCAAIDPEGICRAAVLKTKECITASLAGPGGNVP